MPDNIRVLKIDVTSWFLNRCTVMDIIMLDGYRAAVASGPTLVMLDHWLRCVMDPEDVNIEASEMISLFMLRYQAINDALNDEVYVPRLR